MMPEFKVFPYLTPADDRITVVESWRFFDDDMVINPEELLQNWDVALSIDAEITLQADLDAILEDCGLSDNSKLRLVTGWKSSGTMLRGAGQSADLIPSNSAHPIRLRVEIDGINIAHDVTFFAGLILIRAGATENPLAPKLPGSILWITENKLILDESVLRFPTELLDFSARHWSIPVNAAWYLQWDPTDLYQSIFGDIRLFLNAQHPLVLQSVSGDHVNVSLLQSIIFFDIARALILGGLSNPEFVEDVSQYPDGTIGAAIRDLLSEYFPGISVHTLKSMSANSPFFEAELQHHLQFLKV